MSVNVLQLLEVAYGGSKEDRTEATRLLEEALRSEPQTYVLQLLTVGCNPSSSPESSLSALLYVKNFMLHEMAGDHFRGSAALDQIKTTILQGLAAQPAKHRRVLLVMVGTIISEFGWDYFPLILPSIQSFVPSDGNVGYAQALLDSAYALTKRFKTANLEPMARKMEVSTLLCVHLPKFFQLGDMHVCHMAFKIFECATETFQQLSMKEMQTLPLAPELLTNWLTFMGQFPQQHHATAVQQGGDCYLEYVKCVKRIGSICFSILHDATKKKKAAAIAIFFLERFSPAFLEMWIQWLTFCLEQKDRSTHRKSEIFAIRFIKMANMDERLFTSHIKPNALSILEKQLFPYFCYNEQDEEIFNDDEALQEYSQYILDENLLTGEYSQRQAASNAMLAMVNDKRTFHDPSVLLGVLQILNQGLSQPDTEATAPRTFGFLHLLSILRKVIKEQTPEIYATQLEQVLGDFIGPRISSPFIFIRCKAIYVCQRYCKIPWSNEENFKSFVTAFVNLVSDADARVRLSTIDAMCSFLAMKRACAYLHGCLVPLVNECLYFLEKVQTTFVPIALNYLAEHFAPELTPVLDKLAGCLVQQFLAAAFDMKQAEENLTDSDADMKKMETLGLSAFQSLSAINNIVISTEYNRSALQGMRSDIVRLVRFVFEQPDSFDYMDKAIEIFQHVVFMSKPVPQDCWDLFPVVYKCVMDSGVGVDYFAKFEGVLDNYCSNSPEAFVGNEQVMRMCFDMCEKMLIGGAVANDEDIIAAPQLLEAIMHNAKHHCPQLFAPYLPQFVTLILRSLANPEHEKRGVNVRMWLIVAMMDAFYVDAEVVLSTLQSSGAYPHFFIGYFDFFSAIVAPDGEGAGKKKKKRQSTLAQEAVEALTILFRKVNILGLTSFLMVVTNPQSPWCANIDPNFVVGAVRMINYCIAANKEKYGPRSANLQEMIRKIAAGEDDGEGDDYDEEDMDLGEDEDPETDLANAAANDDDCDEDDDADEQGVEMESTDDYYTPIDQVCEVGYYLSWYQAVKAINSVHFQQSASQMMSEESLAAAQLLSTQYINLLAEFEKTQEADHQKRMQA